MGISGSKYNQNGGMHIQLENTSLFNGEAAIGIIHIIIQIPMNPSTLYLIFKGKEVTHWEESRTETVSNAGGTSSSRTVTDYYNGKARICNFHYPIYRWDYVIPPGGYSLPGFV